MNNVFISYVRDDQNAVNMLAAELRREGLHVWLDRDDILPGQFWEETLQAAITKGAFFIACFSKAFQSRDNTYMREELRIACEQSCARAQNTDWLIPVLLSPCEVPPLPLSHDRTLRDVQWIDLSKDWSAGIWKLLQVVRPASTHSTGIDKWFRGLCKIHVKSIVDRAWSMRAFRMRQIEDGWRSLLLPSRWGPTLDIIVRLFDKVKERKLPLTERWVEPTNTGITIVTTISPTASVDTILKSLSTKAPVSLRRLLHPFETSNHPYEGFVRYERKVLRGYVNWHERDIAHWIFAVDGDDVTVDLLYWTNPSLMMAVYGETLERQRAGQQIGPIENAYPGSLLTVTEFEKLYNAILREETILLKEIFRA